MAHSFLIAPLPILAVSPGASTDAPEALLVLYIAIILGLAKVGGDIAARIGQPAVLGELVIGIVLGNMSFAGVKFFEPIKTHEVIDMLARMGVLILLFEVGLESTVAQLRRVGASAFLVATLGVTASLLLGWGLAAVLLPSASTYSHAFIGASLCATSVGITARVLKDLNKSQTDEARIILGAAVIDDVLGLIILSIATGIIVAADSGETVSYLSYGAMAVKTFGFILISILLGMILSRWLFQAASKLKSRDVLLSVGLAFCFVLAWLASLIGLAPIIGAFVAGLVLEEGHYGAFIKRGEQSLEHLVHPISSFLVPIFFVLMGMKTDLHAFSRAEAWFFAAGLTGAAILGKQICSFGVLMKGVNKPAIGIGMIPRGEVELIFANAGLTLQYHGAPLIDGTVFSAIVMMVIVTTLITPPLLKWRFSTRA